MPGQAGGQQRLLPAEIAAGIGELQPFGGAFAQFEAQAAGQMHLSCDWWFRFEFRPFKTGAASIREKRLLIPIKVSSETNRRVIFFKIMPSAKNFFEILYN